MRKTKQTYVQPTSEVVELHVTNQLLAGSDVNSTRSGYGDAEDQDWN